tara:strand:- start:1259 stop:1948 length:690 start_codon:yes stop_codon:yes gene_type:complete
MKKINILVLALGERHCTFAKKMIASVEKYFCVDISNKFIIFTDNPKLFMEVNNSVIVKVDNLPKPLVNVLKYHYFLKVKDLIGDNELVYSIDSDMEIVKNINIEEIKPDRENQYVAVQHPWAVSEENQWILCQNKESTAYLENTKVYHQSCFYGAQKKDFYNLVEKCNYNTNKDLSNRIIAFWQDEGHFNKYLHGKDVKTLDCSYAMPLDFDNELNRAKITHYNSQTRD